MKKLLSLLLVAVLTFALAAFAVSCGNSEEAEKEEAPIVFNFTAVTEKHIDEETDKEVKEEYYALKSVTISEKAQELVDANDYEGLAKLFNTPVEAANYAKPETEFTKDSVRVLVVPAEYTVNGKKLPVKKILSDAVSGQSFVKEIVVGDNIETIEQGAFSLLSKLEKITLPFVGGEYNALNEKKLFGYIFGSATGDGIVSCTQTYNEGSSSTATFALPSSLKTVVINGGNKIQSENLNYKIDFDEDENPVYVFEDDEKFEELESETLTLTADTSEYAIAPYAFYNCSSIEEVIINGEYTQVEDYTFYGCTAIAELNFADNIQKIGAFAYSGCTSLKSVNFNNVKEIGENAFENCSALGTAYLDGKNPVDLSGVEVIGKNAFANCSGLESVAIGNASIKENAFKSCTAINLVDFTGEVEIGNAAFYGCTALKAIDLEGVVSIGDFAFYGCTELKDVESLGDIPVGEDAFGNTAYAEEE